MRVLLRVVREHVEHVHERPQERGKKNFLELYAVFSSPTLYKVQIAESKRDLGTAIPELARGGS